MKPPAASDLLVPPPTGRARRRASTVIAAVLLFQLLAPLRYYLARERRDERFSWRMFSSVDAAACVLSVYGADPSSYTTVPLRPLLPARWIEELERGQPRVVRAFLRWGCGKGIAAALRYELACTAPSGAALAPVRHQIDCAPPPETRSPPDAARGP